VTDRPGNPVLLLQIIEQRKTLLDFFEIPIHCLLCLWRERRRKPPAFPGKDGGQENFFRDARAREFAESESSKTMAQLDGLPDYRAPANERSGPAFDGERKEPVGSGPVRGPSDGEWRNRGRS
jgi:hypothetical protein